MHWRLQQFHTRNKKKSQIDSRHINWSLRSLWVIHLKPWSLKGTGIHFCVLERCQIMGRDAEQKPDSLCLRPAPLIRVVLCSSWPIAPHCYAGPCLNKQRWYESHVRRLQEIRVPSAVSQGSQRSTHDLGSGGKFIKEFMVIYRKIFISYCNCCMCKTNIVIWLMVISSCRINLDCFI